MIIIAYYGKPDEVKAQERLLKTFLRHINSVYQDPRIVLAGDFNKTNDQMLDLT